MGLNLGGFLGKKIQDIEGGVGNFFGGVANNVGHVVQGAEQAAAPVANNVQSFIQHPIAAAPNFSLTQLNPFDPMGTGLNIARNAAPLFGGALQTGATNLTNATQNTPIGWGVKNFVSPMVSGYGTTIQHTGQILNGQDPYHGNLEQQAGQIGGDVLNAASVLPVGEALKGAQIGLKGAKGLLPQVAKSAATNAAFGAGYGATGAMSQNANASDVLKSAGTSALAGGALGAAVPLAGAGARGVVKGVQNAVAPKATPISSLKIGSDAMDQLNQDRVNQIHQDILLNRPIEPVVTKNVGGQLYVQDGAHRLAAAQQAGLTHIPTIDQGQFLANQRGSVRLPGGDKPVVTTKATPPADIAPGGSPESFLQHTSQSPQFDPQNFNLESDLNKLIGTHKANQMLLPDQLKSKASPADLEAAYHYAEDKTSPVTPAQKAIYDTRVAPILEQTNGVRNELKGTPKELDQNYLPRIAEGKNSRYERYLNDQVQSPEGGAFRKTTPNDKSRVYHTITDENGNSVVAAIKAPKDELGRSTGTKEVTGFQDGKSANFGTFKTKSYEDLMKTEVKPLQDRLAAAKKEYSALQGVRVRGGTSDARMAALARKVAALRDSADALGRPLSKSETRSVRLATLKGKELDRVKPVVSNVGAKTGKVEDNLAYLESAIKQVKDNYNPDNLHGRVFTGLDGKRYTIGQATAKQVEANTSTRYYKNPIASASLAHVNAVNAKAANDFMEAWKLSPDFKDHAMKAEGEGVPPENWKPVDSPNFRGYVFDPETKATIDRLTGGNYSESGSPVIRAVSKAWQGMTSTATQFIVINPAVHGGNLYQMGTMAAGRFGGIPAARAVEFNASLARLVKDPAFRMQNLQDYLRAGGHFEEYGANRETVLTKAMDALHLPETSKLNARAMSGIDATLRSALFDTAKRANVDDATAVKLIDDFMGRKESIGPVARSIGMFYHWFLTTTRVGYNLVRHPVANRGALTNLALGWAVIQGANYAYQQITGNKQAHVRNPGEIGYINDLIKAPGEIAQGRVPTTVESHINPLITAATNQAYSKDIFTGQNIQTGKQRLDNLAQKTLMPTQMINKVDTGHQTPLEVAANAITGLYTPHTKGTQAAPSFGPNSPFNVAGTSADTNQAYQDQQAHYKVLDQQKQKLADDPTLQDKLDGYFNRSHNAQGQTIQLNPSDRMSQYKGLLSNDRLLNSVIATETATKGHAPSWDLPKDQLSTYLNYESQYTGDPERTRMMQKFPWLKDAVQADQNFYSNLPKGGNPAGFQPTAQQQSDLSSYGYSMNDTKYPQFDQQTQNDMTAYNNITDPTARGDFLSSHPNIVSAFGQIGRYTNASRIVEGALPTQDYPEETPHIKQVLDSMPQGSDSASKKARAIAINGNPDVNQYMADVSLYNTTKDLAGYYLKIKPGQTEGQELNNGSAESQQVLKGITSLGQYDIGKSPTGQLSFTQGGVLPTGSVSSSQAAKAKSSAKSSNYKISSALRRVAKKVSFSHVSLPTGGNSRGRAYPKTISNVYVKQVRSSVASRSKPKVSLKRPVV